MTRRRCLGLLCLGLLSCFCLPAGAETYKWVDDKGVTNYSNNPPLSAKPKAVSKVEDKLSFYEPSAALKSVAAAAPYGGVPAAPDWAEIEWLQRQRLMAEKATRPGRTDCPPRSIDCYDDYRSSGYYSPYLPAFAARPAFMPFSAFAPFPRSTKPLSHFR